MILEVQLSAHSQGLFSMYLNSETTSTAYLPEEPDWTISPFTGMTRRHWLDCASYLIDGVFQHIPSPDAPISLPRQSEITYPQPDDPPHRFRSAEFEGLARTLMAAAPLINEDPERRSNGIALRDYYAERILEGTDPSSPRFWGLISEMTSQTGRMQYQQTVEGAALAINLMTCREHLWECFSSAEKQQIASVISDYGHALSIGHNWRFFNVLMLTFLKIHGFRIDEVALNDHLQHILSFYVGDGWYIDDTNFDLYNPWGFHFYGPLWCSWYGNENAPLIAEIIAQRNREFMKTWPNFYSREGKQPMWGRSIIYRFAASTAFGAHFLMDDPVVDPGFARRLASGNLLQFMTREDVFVNGLPCLGYYGPFESLVQFYSCAASPFWLAKVFVALLQPEESPFWQAVENEGHWAGLKKSSNSVELLGPGIQVVNHGLTGTTELRTGKVYPHDAYYNQLQFNPDFPLEPESADGANAASYSVREKDKGDGFRIPLNIAFNKFEDGVLYRLQNTQPQGLGDPSKGGVNRGPERIDLADIVIPGGVIRVDRVRIPYRYELQLGHFALPHVNGIAAQVDQLESGLEATIPDGRRIAILPVYGWDSVKSRCHAGRNPEAPESTVIYCEQTRAEDYGGMKLLITVLLHRIDGQAWTTEELNPFQEWEPIPYSAEGSPCVVRILLKDGRSFLIDHALNDGRRIS